MLNAIEVNAGTILEQLARHEGLSCGQEEENHANEPEIIKWTSHDKLKNIRCPFGILLRECRLAQGKSQKIVAENAGYTLRNLINVEKGMQEPGVMFALKLAIASGYTPRTFFHTLQTIIKNMDT